MKTKLILFAFIAGLLMYIISPLTNIPTENAYADQENTGSTIAGIEVDGLERDELKKTLTKAIDQWLNKPMIVSGNDSSLNIDKINIQFDIDGTISLYESKAKQKWYAFWKDEKIVHLPLEVVLNESVKEELATIAGWDTEETYAKILHHAAYLKTGEVEAVAGDTSILEANRIALAIEEIPETAFGTYDIAAVLNDRVIGPGETFSFIQALGENNESGNTEALQFIASVIYQTALQINSEIVERHSQHEIPVYLEPGIEAAVTSSGDKDLKFINRLATPIKLKLSVEAQQLKVEMYTTQQEEPVATRVVRDEEIKPRTIIRYSNELAVGQVKEVQKGKQGLRVSVYRAIDGVEELVSRDYYPPVNRVLLESARQLQTQQPAESDPDLQIDLDGDGLADVESKDDEKNVPVKQEEEGTENNNKDENPEKNQDKEVKIDEDGNPILPPGSYYDKGGNLITP